MWCSAPVATGSSGSCSPSRWCCRRRRRRGHRRWRTGSRRALIALDPLKIPRVQEIALDGRVLAFTAAIVARHRRPLRHRPGAAVLAHGSAVRAEGRRPRLARRHRLAAPRARRRRDRRVGRARCGGDAARAQLRAAAGRGCGLQPGARADVADVAAGRDVHGCGRDGEAPTPRSAAGFASRPACRRRARSPDCRSRARAATGASGSRVGRSTSRDIRRGRLAGGHARLLRSARHAAARAAGHSPTPTAPTRSR